MLTTRYDLAAVRRNLMPRDQWRPFPKASEREAWEALLASPLNRERRGLLVGQAEAVLGEPWPALPATTYMEFVRNGNRSRYEGPYFRRRRRLGSLVLAECLEFQGRFLDEIANGLWAISEEVSWSVPAHARNAPDPLPSADAEMVDLFAAETAMVVAETLYLVGDALREISPALVKRLERECIRRVIVPVETRNDFWWFSGGNNWTPWICSNVEGAAMYLLDDPDRLATLTYKMMETVDRFIGNYGPDGGCDEGPGYWGVAAGAMLLFLEELYSRSDGAISIYDDPLIVNMGRFIVDTHLSGPWYTNFADAPARLDLRRDVVYRYGERIGAELMKDAVLLAARDYDPGREVYPVLNQKANGGTLNHMLREMFWIPADAEPKNVPNDVLNWFPDLQVMVARESPVLGQGLVLAAKGGHNGESHNHNDLGNFIVMLDGQPAIIDIGVETYSRKTFSEERYTIWCIRASAHNVPLINGTEQIAGRDRRATAVTFSDDDGVTRLGMNLEGAYPEEAGIAAVRREFTFSRRCGASVTVEDEVTVGCSPLAVQVPLYTPWAVEERQPGLLAIGTTPRSLLLRFDPAVLRAAVEDVSIEDERLRSSWGTLLRRITLSFTADAAHGAYRLEFAAES
jgi:hypothetical protein